MPTLLKPREVADALRVDLSTVYRSIASGMLGSVQFGGMNHTVRIPKNEVLRLTSVVGETAGEASSLASGTSRRGVLEDKP